MRRFEDEVDPDRRLPDAERERRAVAARKAYYARLAYRSSVARGGRKLKFTAKPEIVVVSLDSLMADQGEAAA